MLLVHSGNRIDLPDRQVARFPSSQIPVVRARVVKVLESLQPGAVVSSAAAGADLIVLEEAINLGIDAHVVMPLAREEFVPRSVADAGPEWVTRFDSVLRHVATHAGSSLMQYNDRPSDEWYLTAHVQLLERAEEVAAGRVIVALTIRPPEGEVPPSVTDDFVIRAQRMRLLVLSIDPRPSSPATATVS
ncbi:MAG TPA: hypothetical protein VLD86_12570 [Ilumatobacteraceae bacterium]|nr:hypothetical protein [Ilumatobacteraceae bacterium]